MLASRLGAIIRDDAAGPATHTNNLVELAGDTDARDRRVGHQHQALPRVVVDHSQDAQARADGTTVRRRELRSASPRRCS